MLGLVGVVAMLTVLGLSLVITRLATNALVMTGLSREAAKFQARSAFTGTGFTSSETEKVVDHPVRRRIIMLLMIARSAGLVSIIISLILSFGITESESGRLYRLFALTGGILLLWLASLSRFVERGLNKIIDWALRWWTDLNTRDYESLLDLGGDYAVTELLIRKDDWLAGKTMEDCELTEEGVTILGINRADGDYVGVPEPSTRISPGDTIILYGRASTLSELSNRRDDAHGRQAHQAAINQQLMNKREQDRREREREQEN